MAKKSYRSVAQMVREISEGPRFSKEFDQRIRKRQIVKALMALRGSRGLSQKEIADRMGCSQSRVSKLEASNDDDVRLGDLVDYASILDLGVGIVLTRTSATAVDQVRYHANRIQRLLDHLATLALTDEKIANGVSRFFGETTCHLLMMLQDSVKKLPMPPEGAMSQLEIEVCDVESQEGDGGSRDRGEALPLLEPRR